MLDNPLGDLFPWDDGLGDVVFRAQFFGLGAEILDCVEEQVALVNISAESLSGAKVVLTSRSVHSGLRTLSFFSLVSVR